MLETDAASLDPEQAEAALRERFLALGRVAVAVSGGVDSLTLATVAHRALPRGDCFVFHAVSPAVPAEATERVRGWAITEGWRLTVFDAGEFGNTDYRRNPVDRCFYCKQSLYESICVQTDATPVSGTNRDDLGEYRPGLQAAARFGVRHPYVEIGLTKTGVRRLAAHLGLGAMADLPAAPCLASRVETGLRIEASQLRWLHAVEQLVAARLVPKTVRCRIRREAVVVELDRDAFARLTAGEEAALRGAIRELAATGNPLADGADLRFAEYRVGSAFLTR